MAGPSDKPKIFNADLKRLPSALEPLKFKRRWVLWELMPRGDRWTKPPYRPSGQYASSDNPDTWSSYLEVVRAVGDGFDGIGYVIGPDDAALDLDDCRDPVTGSIASWAMAAVRRMGSYTEVTPSGAGLRIIGTSPGERVHQKFGMPDGGSCEFYRKEAVPFITITGAQLSGTGDTLSDITVQFDQFLAECELAKTQKRNGRDNTRSGKAYGAAQRMRRAGKTFEQARDALLNHKDAGIREWARDYEDEDGQRQLHRAYESDEPASSDFRIQTSSEYIADFKPPDYVVDYVIQRGFVYAVTAHTGQGKTAIALVLAQASDAGGDWGGVKVYPGATLYFAGENPDEVRNRWIAMGGGSCRNVYFVAGTKFSIRDQINEIKLAAAAGGPLSAIIVDTKQAYFEDENENDNMPAVEQARNFRELTTLKGNPAIIILCHPRGSARGLEQMIPRGGTAFLGEIDGNITCVLEEGLIEVRPHPKFRGSTNWGPLNFSLDPINLPAPYKDTMGRPIPTVIAMSVTDKEIERIGKNRNNRMFNVLGIIVNHPGASITVIAEKMSWFKEDGEYNRSGVSNEITRRLVPEGFVEKDEVTGSYAATVLGKKALEKFKTRK